MRSASRGVSEAKSRASTTSVGVGNGGPSLKVGIGSERDVVPRTIFAALDDDVAEQLGLLRTDAAEPHQLEHGQQRDDDLGPSPLAARERGEQQRPGIAQNRQDLRHALQQRHRLGLHLARASTRLLADEALDRPLELMDGQVLERHVVGRWELAARAAPDEGLLGFLLGQPRPEGLDPRVLAQTLLQLVAECLALLVELLVVLVGRDEKLRLEVDQRRCHDQIGAGGLEILELQRLEVSQVLIGDGADGQRGEIDLVGAAEVQQQVERALELPDAKREEIAARTLARRRGHGVSGTTRRTSSIVASATLRARIEPVLRTSTIRSGFSANAWRRSRIGASAGSRCLRSTSLQSRQPIAAVRHPVAQYSRSGGGVKMRWRSNTGHTSGLPGSVRRLRAGSVTIGRTFCLTVSGGSER